MILFLALLKRVLAKTMAHFGEIFFEVNLMLLFFSDLRCSCVHIIYTADVYDGTLERASVSQLSLPGIVKSLEKKRSCMQFWLVILNLQIFLRHLHAAAWRNSAKRAAFDTHSLMITEF